MRFRIYPSRMAVSRRGMSRTPLARDKTIPEPCGNKGDTLLQRQKLG